MRLKSTLPVATPILLIHNGMGTIEELQNIQQPLLMGTTTHAARRDGNVIIHAESFEHNGVTVTLSELSALQRIEHLALMKRQAEQAESDSNRKFTVEDAIRTGAFLVAMSLWHNHPKKTKLPSMNEAVNRCRSSSAFPGDGC